MVLLISLVFRITDGCIAGQTRWNSQQGSQGIYLYFQSLDLRNNCPTTRHQKDENQTQVQPAGFAFVSANCHMLQFILQRHHMLCRISLMLQAPHVPSTAWSRMLLRPRMPCTSLSLAAFWGTECCCQHLSWLNKAVPKKKRGKKWCCHM